MFVHFAFGKSGKTGRTQEQTKAVIDHILREKRLKVSKCKEFIPDFPDPNSKPIPIKQFKAVEGRTDLVVAEIDGNSVVDMDSIEYFPIDVPMICFIKTTFSQLRNSMHAKEYGKLGIVLTNDFLKTKGIQRVHYYTEESLYRDPLILEWNYGWSNRTLSDAKVQRLQKEITAYRKPAKLFPGFGKSGTHIIHFGSGQPQTEYFTYNRYPEWYDFTKEQEHRIVLDEGVEFLCFEEGDLYMIIAPDLKAKKAIETFLNQNWRKKPKVEVYPN